MPCSVTNRCMQLLGRSDNACIVVNKNVAALSYDNVHPCTSSDRWTLSTLSIISDADEFKFRSHADSCMFTAAAMVTVQA